VFSVSVVAPSRTVTAGVIALPVYVCVEIASTVKVMTLGFTVILQEAVLPPSSVVTVIVAVPTLTPLTTPPVTVATAVLLLLHVTFLFAALEGVIAELSSSVPPTTMLVDVLFKDTPVTATGLTVTAQDAVLPPSAVVTVIVAVPTLTPVTKPPVTVATAVLLLLHVTFLFAALAGVIAELSSSVLPTKMPVDVLFKITPLTATGLTVTVQEAVLPPSTVVTVIDAVPTLTPLTTPLVDTVATAVLLLLHVTFWFVALAGVIAAVRSSVPPTTMPVDVLFRDTPVTGTAVLLTVTIQEAVLPPSAVVTVIVAVPALTAVTKPPDTVATAVLPLLHVTFLFVA